MAGQIEQCRADRAGGSDNEDRSALRQGTAQGEHLVRCQIGEWDTHGCSRLDAIGDGYKKARGPNRVLGVAAGDTQIGD